MPHSTEDAFGTSRALFDEVCSFMGGQDAIGLTHGELEARLAVGNRERRQRAASAWKLTRREAQVLELLLRGQSNKAIASSLKCAESTVELHVTRVLRKSGASSRMELASRFWSGT